MAVVDALVTFVGDPERFFEGFKFLTIRHIKYGVKAEYAKAFGKAILCESLPRTSAKTQKGRSALITYRHF